ncbi:MAG: S1 RNA-binding domain-containing protein [Endomicrobium sp.]|jgi:small subunit ribosomal protein S1|nr:S1 RNA-binding domain-containing protein [Endomicrobium sp.]
MVERDLGTKITSFEDSEKVSMADLMASCGGHAGISLGEEIEVAIVEENSDGFMVDLGTKFEGIILKKEFEDMEIPSELKVGATVKVKVINTNGQPILSYREIIEKLKWDAIDEGFKNKRRVTGTILKAIKNGFVVDIGGINAFLHISQVDTHFVEKTDQYIGKSYEFVITDFDKGNKNLIVSRRKIIEDEKNMAKKATLESIVEGQILDGTVSKIVNFGAFVDIGGVNGLLHINDLAWYKIKKVENLLHVGQTVRVRILKIDKVNEKISLSIKNLTPHPWDCVTERFPVGLVVKGRVTSIVDYGVFIELEPGVEGLLHFSEYAWSDSELAIKKEVKEGQEIDVKIINIDEKNKKIALSVKAMLPNPWGQVLKHYTPGTVSNGIVQDFMPFGAFVRLPDGITGLVHISNFSWVKKIKHPEDVLKIGDEVKVVVLEIDSMNEKISLSLKHTKPDPYKKYSVGDVVNGKVVKIADFGSFMELEPGIEALIRNNEASSIKIGKSQLILKEGEEIEAKIIKIDVRGRKIDVSIKKLEIDREKELVKQYANQDNKLTLGEILSEE